MLNAVNVQVRGCEVDPGLRAHFEDKLRGLERVWSRMDDAQVRVSQERGQYVAEVTLFSGGMITRAEERNHDLRQAFDTATHRLQSQLSRYKDKIQHKARRQNNRDDVTGTVLHPKGSTEIAVTATLAALNNRPTEQERPAVDGDIPEAELAADLEPHMANGFAAQNGNQSLDALVRVKRFALKPMTAEEAVLQMDLLGHDFFVFRDANNNEVSVVYKRSNGGYGLIEPVPD